MSLILSLETATKVCSVALHDKGNLLGSSSISEEYSHFEKLPGLIQGIFDKASRSLNEVDAVAVSKGPGSYTGLRIGVSMAKGIAFSLNKPILSVNTLEAMALHASGQCNESELLCPMIDARRSEVYCTVLSRKREPIWPVQALIVEKDTFDSLLTDNNLVLFGDGSVKFRSLFEDIDTIRFIDIEPDAEQIGELAWEKFQQKEFEDIAYFEPYYLKDFKPGISKKRLTL